MSEREKFSEPKSTFEMDGLLTQEDIDNRFYVMGQCLACGEWNRLDTRDYKYKCKCGGDQYNLRESRSIRTWLTTKDMKKVRRSKKDNKA
jgi:predicted ATP-dependent serine protease